MAHGHSRNYTTLTDATQRGMIRQIIGDFHGRQAVPKKLQPKILISRHVRSPDAVRMASANKGENHRQISAEQLAVSRTVEAHILPIPLI